MRTLYLTGQTGAGRSQALASIQQAGWYVRGKSAVIRTVNVPAGHINNINQILAGFAKEMVDRPEPLVVGLDIEAAITPTTIRRINQWAQDAGVDQLFVAYVEG